jgi:hypothetical protein
MEIKVGDMVKVIKTGTYPVGGHWFDDALGKIGEVIKTEEDLEDHSFLLYFVKFEDTSDYDSLWFAKEHLELIGSSKLQQKIESLEMDLETFSANALKAMELKDKQIEKLELEIKHLEAVIKQLEETVENNTDPCYLPIGKY